MKPLTRVECKRDYTQFTYLYGFNGFSAFAFINFCTKIFIGLDVYLMLEGCGMQFLSGFVRPLLPCISLTMLLVHTMLEYRIHIKAKENFRTTMHENKKCEKPDKKCILIVYLCSICF